MEDNEEIFMLDKELVINFTDKFITDLKDFIIKNYTGKTGFQMQGDVLAITIAIVAMVIPYLIGRQDLKDQLKINNLIAEKVGEYLIHLWKVSKN